MEDLEDRIADLVLKEFDALPVKCKPIQDAQKGSFTWVPLCGIVISSDGKDLICAAIATGMKCLPTNKIPQAQGLVLHDWHAEILAIRAFNHFLINECHSLASSNRFSTSVLRRRERDDGTKPRSFQPFTLRENLQIHMYCSEAPCGDASMELAMNAQEVTTPWPTKPVESEPNSNIVVGLKGRGFFSELGIVRRKPSRADSPPTLSKSCTDKLALKQCTSLLSSPASLLISPESAYLHSLIIPSAQHVEKACHRAFGRTGRMESVSGKAWGGGYAFHPFDVRSTNREFRFSKRSMADHQHVALKGSNISAVGSPSLQETLIGGILQGRKHIDPRRGSALCRANMWKAVAKVIALVSMPIFCSVSSSTRYSSVKQCKLLEDRRLVKEDLKTGALKGWIDNAVDDFEFESR